MKNDTNVINSPQNRRSFLKTGFNLGEKRAIRRSERAWRLDSTCHTRRLERSSIDLDNS